jgi:hypothetical protein
MNEELELTLDDAVQEVLGQLTGLDLTYDPQLDRYRAIVRQLNNALRLNALEREWSYYASTQSIGVMTEDQKVYLMPSSIRPRMIGDDAVRLVKQMDDHQHAVRWAYFLPRDALSKHEHRDGLWCSVVRNELHFNRYPFTGEVGLDIQVPVMREPQMFRLPDIPEDPEDPLPEVPTEVREQLIDFPYPDIITMRAAALYAATDPVLQPRVQTLEAMHTDLRYQIQERDDRNTDSPYMNEWFVPMEGSINGGNYGWHGHPHADERRI